MGDFGVPIAIFTMVIVDIFIHDVYTEVSVPQLSYNVVQFNMKYRQISNIRRTLVGDQIFYHSDVIAA